MQAARAHASAAAVFLSATAGAIAQPVFQPLGFPPGAVASYGKAISGDGRTAAGRTTQVSTGPAWWWVSGSGGPSLIPTAAGATPGYPYAVSPDGRFIAGVNVGSSGAAAGSFRFDTVANTLTIFPSSGGISALQARDVTASGDLFVGTRYQVLNFFQPMKWNLAGTPTAIPPLSTETSWGWANACTADGGIIVGTFSNPATSGGAAFRWTAATGTVALATLPPVPPEYPKGEAHDLSADGTVVVGWSGSRAAPTAVRWTQAGGPFALCTGGVARAVSADGTVIVGTTVGEPGRAFVWDATRGVRDLRPVLLALGASSQLQGWILNTAEGISASGRTIIGTGTDELGRTQAYIARLKCYPDCDENSPQPLLNVNDFICFLNKFAAADPYANCDGSTTVPVLTAGDFICFQSRFAVGCD